MKVQEIVRALSALAQESRLRVFRLLVQCGPEGMPAGEIARALDLPPATLSFHLSQLAAAGLVESRRESRIIRYSTRIQGVRELLDYLVEDCCGGRPELCRPIPAAADSGAAASAAGPETAPSAERSGPCCASAGEAT